MYSRCKLQWTPVSKSCISFLPPGQAEAEHVPNNQLYICPVYPVDWTSTSRYPVYPVFSDISGMSSMTFLLQAKERWTMYQLKAHFMPQLYWFGLIKVTQLIKSSFFLTDDIFQPINKYFQPDETDFIWCEINATGLVGRPGHLQEGAPLWNEIRISDVGPKILHKNNDDEPRQFKIQFLLCDIVHIKTTFCRRYCVVVNEISKYCHERQIYEL